MEGRFNGGFFCVTGLGEGGLIFGGAYFRNFTVSTFRRLSGGFQEARKKVHSVYSFEVKYRTVELILSCRFKKKVYFVNTY